MLPTRVVITPQQQVALDLFQDDETTEILFGGSAGGGKSVILGLLAVLRCQRYPGVKEAICRKELKRLSQTTFATLLSKVHPLFGIKQSDFHMERDGTITYLNGSQIVPLELIYQPSDPDMSTLGSLEFTDVFIDEVGEVAQKAYSVISSRRGRWKNDEYGIIGKLVTTANPSQNFIRNEFYDPYSARGGGTLQRWEHGQVVVNGEHRAGYRAFVRAGAADNLFLPPNYIETLKSLPPQEYKQFYLGDWNYADSDSTLFRSTLLDKAIAYEVSEGDPEKFNSFIGVDVADKGKDKTVYTLIRNGVIVTQKVSSVSLGSSSEQPMSKLLSDELIEWAQQNGFTPSKAKNIAIECNGVGVGIRDMMKTQGWYITEYTATGQSRSEGYYDFMLDMDSGSVKILNHLDNGELRKQLAAHTYEMENQKPKVVKKDKIKEALGRSPDNADSAMIANYVRRGSIKTKRTAFAIF